MSRMVSIGIVFAVAFAGFAAPEAGLTADVLFNRSQWIAQPAELNAAAPRFTATFTVDRDGPAPIAICGLGQYVATLNGKPLGRGDEFNLPGWTRTSKSCFYNLFQPVLKARSVNTLEITLGNGMYNVPHPGKGLYTKFVGSEGTQKLIVGGVVKSAAGGWKVSASEIVRTHVYSGDDIDATADRSKTFPAVLAEAPKGVLREAPFVCRLQEVRKPVKTHRVSDEELTLDFAQSSAYVPTVTAKGPRGSRVEIAFTDVPALDDRMRIRPLTRDLSRCLFTLAGTGRDETFSPPFFYYGFRYMRVRLLPAAEDGPRPALVSAEARVVSADMPRAGSFECSIPLFNRIHDLCWWAQRSNMQSVFTDCPHREKLGWLEQDNLHSDQIRWGWNANALFAKTCMDIADSQLSDGMVPDIAPEFTVFRGGFRHSIEWGSSSILIPWQQYEWTGDDSLIREYYPVMVAYHTYLRTFAHHPSRGDFIMAGGLGDWYADTGAVAGVPPRKTSINLTATVFYYMNAKTLAQCADLLGKKDEAETFRAEAGKIKAAFNAKWWHPATASYENNSQTANAMALATGLADPAFAGGIVSNIVADVRARGNAVAAGEIGYPFLLQVLADHGHDGLIFDMTSVTNKPGYGYMIAKGNTSCHEAWDARTGSSHNHFMMADIVNWFYGSLAGIRRTSPGFKTFTVAPAFLEGLDWVKASHTAAGGEIRVAWHKEGRGVRLTVTVPPGTVATIRLPGKADVTQEPGERSYSVVLQTQ